MNKKRAERRRQVRRRRLELIVAGLVVLAMLTVMATKIITGDRKNTNGNAEVAMEGSAGDNNDMELQTVKNTEESTVDTESTASSIVQNPQENLSMAGSAYLNVKWIAQNPELPTGCEITSLTTVLQYYGYNVSKTTMARQYLETGTGSFFENFVGSPFLMTGYGCMAQPIVNAANKYFTTQKISAEAKNVSGSNFNTLLGYVSGGNPVIVWNTMYMEEPYISESWYEDGELISWVAPEHCVVLIGYNLEKGVVYVSDPLEGIVTRDLSLFAEYYEAVYAQAVVIQR